MIEYDKFGHCVVCHKNMLIEEVIDNRIQKRFTPEYVETEYLLSDGSKMRVAMCEHCKNTLPEGKEKEVMECVKKGWIVELDNLPQWSSERKTAYLDKYLRLDIVNIAEGIPKDILDKKLKEYKDKKK